MGPTPVQAARAKADATAEPPRAPPAVRRLDRHPPPIASPPVVQIAWSTQLARAWGSEEAARLDTSPPVPLVAPGARFDAIA